MEIRIATNDDIEYMMSSRLEMLKEVNLQKMDVLYTLSVDLPILMNVWF